MVPVSNGSRQKVYKQYRGLIVKIGLGGPLYYTYNEDPQIKLAV